MTVHVSFDIEEAQKAELDRIALRENTTLQGLVTRLLQDRLEYERWFAAEVQKGLDSARRGETISHEDVVARMRARAAELTAKKLAG